MKVAFSNDGNKYYEIQFPGSSRKAYLADRDVSIDKVKESVYILMDKRKRCFYIGQTGDSDCAGFVNRSAVHKWEKKWWEQALVFTDANGDFQEKLRKCIEGRLNEIAKAANTSLILSIGKKNPSEDIPDCADVLKWILTVCQFLGVPWSYPIEDTPHDCLQMRQKNKQMCWKSRAKVCQALVDKYNNGSGKGGVDSILGCRVSVKSGKWREILEGLGLKFDDAGKLSSDAWKDVPANLPTL